MATAHIYAAAAQVVGGVADMVQAQLGAVGEGNNDDGNSEGKEVE